MKATGIVRKFDGLGRIVIPKEIRERYHITEDTAMEIFIDDEGCILLRKFHQDEISNKLVEIIAEAADIYSTTPGYEGLVNILTEARAQVERMDKLQ